MRTIFIQAVMIFFVYFSGLKSESPVRKAVSIGLLGGFGLLLFACSTFSGFKLVGFIESLVAIGLAGHLFFDSKK